MDRGDSIKLSEVQREILVGTILGDAHLETRTKGATYRVKFEQSSEKKDYIEHLFEIFEPLTKSGLRTNRGNICFQTTTSAVFKFYGQQFYRDSRKIVPKLIAKWLTPRALSYWYMDDGSMKSSQSKGVILNTQSFTLSEVERLCQAIQSNFGLQVQPRRQKEGHQIYVSGNSFEDFVKLTEPYIHSSMRYKIPSARKHKCPKSTGGAQW